MIAEGHILIQIAGAYALALAGKTFLIGLITCGALLCRVKIQVAAGVAAILFRLFGGRGPVAAGSMAAMQRLVDCRLAIGGPGDIGLRDGSTVLDLCCRGRCRR